MAARSSTLLIIAGICIAALAAPLYAASPAAEALDRLLQEGKPAEAAQRLATSLKEKPDDHTARFGLAVATLFHGVEHFIQELHAHGLRVNPDLGMLRMIGVPITGLPVPPAAEPKEISYEQLRKLVEDFLGTLKEVDDILAQLPPSADLNLPLHFGLIRLDLDGDGKVGDAETFWQIYAGLNRGTRITPEQAAEFVIAFDRTDAEWLRGYCHFVMALGEFALAHDTHELFERTAHLVFARPVTPYPFLREGKEDFVAPILDMIAGIHLINFPVKEPERLKTAHAHLLEMLERSGRMMALLQEETDDDREWIPSPRQTGVIPNVRVEEQMIRGWHDFLEEARELLEGKKLIPFWRGASPRGVNLKRVFFEPRQFDLVLWIQGTAAAPYLEDGELTKPETWDRLQSLFDGRFWTFAAWLN